MDVEALLEVVLEREVDERAPVCGQLHRRRQAALHHGEVAGREVSVEIVDVGADLESVDVICPKRSRVDPRSCDDDHPKLRDEPLGLWERRDHAAQQIRPDSRAADSHDAYALVGRVAKLRPQLAAVAERGGVKAGDVAGELEVRLGPVTDQRQAGAEPVGDDVVGSPTKIARSRTPGWPATCSTICAL